MQTDHVVEYRRPDVVVLDKHEKMCHLIDIAVPGDSRVESKENDYVHKYQDLARELRKLWQVKSCSCGSESTGYNPEGVGETSQGDRNLLE